MQPQGTPENVICGRDFNPSTKKIFAPNVEAKAVIVSLHYSFDLFFVLEITEKFSIAAASHNIATDYVRLDCITSIFTSLFSRSQPLAFWKALFPALNRVFNLHGATLIARENGRFLKQVAFHLLRLALMTDVQVTEMKSDGTLQESSEALRLRKSLQEMADENRSFELLKECVLPENALVAIGEVVSENRWSWSEVKYLSGSLLLALDASLEHALLASEMTVDRYAAAESSYKLAMAYASVPDLHIIWLLRLCDAHLEMQSWAEAAQCAVAVAVAGVVMQALVGRNVDVWSRDHVPEGIRVAYEMLHIAYTLLTNIDESIPMPVTDATYYRVGFYGDRFGKLDRKEYVYREPCDVRIGDIMEKLSHIYESSIIQDFRQVKADELQSGVCYLQITAMDPVMEDEDLSSRRERVFSLSTGSMCARVRPLMQWICYSIT
ncbi:hypothetical protein HHK36_031691 [Tetracentron sinense]|uniref:DOCKER Lobe A domain-containing protein n=1 Tax=Tetracentron sinense TaxID=13715 RepID=A0A835CXU2_TETSI|nr:hypothetical protein HHK36_031691 [Tetracentron sinense]